MVRFYQFWFTFKSWRDFTFKGKHRLDEAENRDEKRWMMRENKTKANKAKKAETQKGFCDFGTFLLGVF